MYYNPWTKKYDSPVNYRQPAKDIIADCCAVNTRKMCNKLRIFDDFIQADIIAKSYERAISTISQWNTEYPIYNHCWEAVHSVYPELIKQKHKYETIDTYDNVYTSMPIYRNGEKRDSDIDDYFEMVELATEYGITPYYTSFDEYQKNIQLANVRRRLEMRRNLNV